MDEHKPKYRMGVEPIIFPPSIIRNERVTELTYKAGSGVYNTIIDSIKRDARSGVIFDKDCASGMKRFDDHTFLTGTLNREAFEIFLHTPEQTIKIRTDKDVTDTSYELMLHKILYEGDEHMELCEIP